MRHYSFHIGDYAAAARYLSRDEDLAFRRLLDAYYLDEVPLPADVDTCARRIGMHDVRDSVERVLQEFFELQDGVGWVNHRAAAQIADYHAQIESCKRGGQRSAESRRGKREAPQSPTPPDDRGARRRGRQPSTTPAQPQRNTSSTPVERQLHGSAAAAQGVCNQPETNNQYPPNPPTTGGRAAARGASAAHEKPEPAAEPDSRTDVERLAHALLATPYRCGIGNPFQRRVHLFDRATELLGTGLTPEDVAQLDVLDSEQCKGTPGSLLATWLDSNTWRMEIDQQAANGRQVAAKRRGRVAAGGPQHEPKPLAELLPAMAGQGVA